MKDIPIIFSAPMVRALLDGSKSMTRRLLYTKREGVANCASASYLIGHPAPRGQLSAEGFPTDIGPEECWTVSPWHKVKCGDRLWVREGWKPHSLYADMRPRDIPKTNVFYLSDPGYSPSNVRGKPSIHMPRWASRLTLIVTGTKVDRLNDISEVDAVREGCKVILPHCFVFDGTRYDQAGLCHSSPITAFSTLWDELHGRGAWEQNPEVVAISFRVIKANIDSPEARVAA